jgi:hypothetical protein
MVVGGGLQVEEYEWTMGNLSEAAAWPEEDGGWSTSVNSARKKTRSLNSVVLLR